MAEASIIDQRMEQASEVCDQCEGTTFQLESVRSAFWHGDRLVVIEDIPALVCDGCGERYYDDETVMMLDLMRSGDFPVENSTTILDVPVFSFANRTT
jgi:YgiT-type zinc finger domain-containing protein